MEEGTMPIKSLRARWMRKTFQTLSYGELFMTSMKMKNNFCNWCQYEIPKSRDGRRNKAYKVFANRMGEGNIPNTISHMELFMATMKMKNNLCDEYQYEMQNSWDGGGNNTFKIFMSRMEEGKYYMQPKYLVWRCS